MSEELRSYLRRLAIADLSRVNIQEAEQALREMRKDASPYAGLTDVYRQERRRRGCVL